MSTTQAAERFTALPGGHALAAAVTAPGEHSRTRLVLIRQPVEY
jgi:nanoRNase/pAp phosphatase (c-di-AMP/oligoRNAs hydrolase)